MAEVEVSESGSVPAVPAKPATVAGRVAKLLTAGKTPISVAISIAAIVLSIGTTITSTLHTRQQEVHDLRSELRSLLQRMSVLQRDNAEIVAKYNDNPLTMGAISNAINQENALVAKQARDIARRLGEKVSSVEYIAIASGLLNSGEYALSREMALAALLRAQANGDFYENVFALRGLGQMAYQSGDAEEGRVRYAAAEKLILGQVFADDMKNYMLAYSYLGWASSAMAVHRCNDANEHYQQGLQYNASSPWRKSGRNDLNT